MFFETAVLVVLRPTPLPSPPPLLPARPLPSSFPLCPPPPLPPLPPSSPSPLTPCHSRMHSFCRPDPLSITLRCCAAVFLLLQVLLDFLGSAFSICCPLLFLFFLFFVLNISSLLSTTHYGSSSRLDLPLPDCAVCLTVTPSILLSSFPSPYSFSFLWPASVFSRPSIA